MSEIDTILSEWEKLANDATEGPWIEEPETEKMASGIRGGDNSLVAISMEANDLAFIAASREAVPRLIAALRHVLECYRGDVPLAVFHQATERELAAILTGRGA